ncbi:odorant-binding protein [Culex quinquefasciatus]|uniref:Odorant-binding protein n=2 Tax=Culex quinquefasciatus TaxID=7176 RepID=B0WBT5_CULQU|nr:uncharacterized protein LOC128092835 [Culex pipiens pallens]EDS42865.1 odorant-binding protein [Culex quinquefasciatus]|eukprot:XP_001846169.1 odorant-binding protein [Culex quinquefasciatus]
MLKFVICLAFLGLVAAYDFKDSFYNELLLEDLLDSEDVLTSADRFRRSPAMADPADDKCKKQHHKHKCCNDANTDNLDKIRDLKKQCFSEQKTKERSARGMIDPVDMFNCEKMNKTKQDLICAIECVGRKKSILDKDGNLLEATKLVPFVKENFAADPWQEPLVEGFVDTCLKEVAEKMAAKTEEFRCNPASSHFGYCMWRQTTMACPKEKQEQSKKCEKIREKLANNEPITMFGKHDFDDN